MWSAKFTVAPTVRLGKPSAPSPGMDVNACAANTTRPSLKSEVDAPDEYGTKADDVLKSSARMGSCCATCKIRELCAGLACPDRTRSETSNARFSRKTRELG